MSYMKLEDIDNSAKIFIIQHYIANNTNKQDYNPKVLFNQLFNTFFGTIGYITPEDMYRDYMFYILLMKYFNVDEKKIQEEIIAGNIVDFTFGYIKDNDFVKKMINNAETVHVVLDPITGESEIKNIH